MNLTKTSIPKGITYHNVSVTRSEALDIVGSIVRQLRTVNPDSLTIHPMDSDNYFIITIDEDEA